jgi:hypothetical protein
LEDRRFVGSSEAIKKHSATLAVYQKSRPARWVNGVRQDVPINHLEFQGGKEDVNVVDDLKNLFADKIY